MTVHLIQALDLLREKLLHLASETESSLCNAIDAFNTRDMVRAKRVIANDSKIDELEVELEEECLKTLALYQPVAEDLRAIVTTLKINNDLERIADLAANLSSRAVTLSKRVPPKSETMNLDTMTETIMEMFRSCIHAFVDKSPETARKVLELDRVINREHTENYRRAETLLAEYPDDIPGYISLLSTSRYLERIGDMCKNIAEDIIYMVDGKIIRHSPTLEDEG